MHPDIDFILRLRKKKLYPKKNASRPKRSFLIKTFTVLDFSEYLQNSYLLL